MSPRSIILSIAAAAVVGLGIYLFLQVRADRDTPPPPPPRVAASAAPVADVAPQAAPAPPPVLAVPAPELPPPPAEAARQDGSAVAAGSAKPAQPIPTASLIGLQGGRYRSPLLHPLLGHTSRKGDPDQMLDQADKAYAAGELDRAASIDRAVLDQTPGNVRALSLLVATSCAQGKQPDAQSYYVQLPAEARAAAKSACSLSLQDPSP